ncbi:MAG: HD domain-containing protein [Deltaproteobacteria bacterium]|nr:HD domain-containing protein [Deltaproteobacteria bacterium]
MSQRVFEAIEFATKAHTGQFRKGTKVPYIVHPLGVAKILIEAGCSEDVAVAGILHDTVEDTSFKTDDIRREFGEEVARLVEWASEPDKSDTWENRKRHTIDILETASMDAVYVSLADKLANIRDIRADYEKLGDDVFLRFNRPKDKQEWYYRAMAGVFSKRIVDEPFLSLVLELRFEIVKVFQGSLSAQGRGGDQT